MGTIQLALKKGHASELHATLVGRDGSAFGLSASDLATVPVGEYRLGTVTATFNDPQGGESWSFVFSDNGAKGDPKWYNVGKDQQLAIDPVGVLDMELSVADKMKTVRAGEDISLQPLLYTGDGLLINVAYRGAPVSPRTQESLGAISTLVDDRWSNSRIRPFGLCLRHLLHGLSSSAFDSTSRPRSAFHRVSKRTTLRNAESHNHARGDRQAVRVKGAATEHIYVGYFVLYIIAGSSVRASLQSLVALGINRGTG